jgi:hypothetical protein
MVIDEGFDLSVSELRANVAAAYTIVCDGTAAPDPGDPTGDANTALATLKQHYIAALMTADDSCHLAAGISAKHDPLVALAGYKDRWNAMIRSNTAPAQAFSQAEWSQLSTAINAEMQVFAYHGTSTSGTVAHDNPNARFVLVEQMLGSMETLQQQFTCFVQADVDQATALLTDPDVQAALANQPRSSLDTGIGQAIADFNVGLVNESFGTPSRVVFEQLQATAGCATVDLRAYFAALAQEDHLRAQGQPAVLTVQAAGNDGVEIDTASDSIDCDIGDPLHLSVGAIDPTTWARTTFSNFGACVDVYAPGQYVIAPYAGDWLLPVAGTSFAAPITVRVITQTPAVTFDPAAARTALLAERDSSGLLSIALFPLDSFYLPVTTTAFVGRGTLGERAPAPALAAFAPAVVPVRVDLTRFRRALRPLVGARAVRQAQTLARAAH